MPYELKPEPGENILLDVLFQLSRKSEPFHFAISDVAFYFPAKKFVISGDPHFFQRVPNSEIKEVCIQSVRPYGSWIFAILMILAGVAIGISCFAASSPVPPRVYGWALALVAGGMILPFAAKGRQRLVVTYTNGTFRWNPPYVVDTRSKQQVKALLQSIVDVSRTLHIPAGTRGETVNELSITDSPV